MPSNKSNSNYSPRVVGAARFMFFLLVIVLSLWFLYDLFVAPRIFEILEEDERIRRESSNNNNNNNNNENK
jgi:hypothetical protein